MDLEKSVNWYYLTHRFPPGGFSWPLRIFFIILFGGALALAIYSGIKRGKISGYSKKLWNKIQIWGWTVSLIGFSLFLFREVRAIYLSARIYMFSWVLITIIWLIVIVVMHKLNTPNKEEMAKKKKEYDKWLPQQKK